MKKRKLLLVIVLLLNLSICTLNVKAETREPKRVSSDFCNSSDEVHYEKNLKIGEIYNYVNYVPVYDDGINSIREGAYVDVKWTTYKWISYKHITWEDYIVLPKYVYSIYQVGVVDAPYWSETPKQYYKKYVDEISFNVTRTTKDTYEHSLKNTLNNEFGGKVYSGAGFQIGDILTNTYEENFINKHEIEKSESRSEKIKIWDDGYYCSQRRATYKMYIVLAFEAEYEKTERVQKVIFYNDKIYTYTLKGYRYKGKSLQFEYTGSSYEALSRYLFDDYGNLYYVPIKDSINYKENYIYL